MKASIIIPTYNEEDCIERCIKAVLNQNHKDLEVILVDDGSTDKTAEIAKRYPIKIVKGKHGGNSAAKNFGWKKAKGDVVIFIDADMVIHPKYVYETLKCYEDKKIGGTTHIESRFNKKPSFIARMLTLRKIIGELMDPICVKACRRNFINTIGGFNSNLGYFDDWELGMRIKKEGYNVVWTKGKVWHEEIEKLKDLIKQNRWYGKSIGFKEYKMKMIKKFSYSLLCFGIPIYILFLFLGFPFWVFGVIGLFLFLAVELNRLFKIFFYTKNLESLFIPMFDWLFESIVFIGILDRHLFGKGVKR